MLRVGLTGGLGSGKSTVAAMLRDCGAAVSSSDDIGRSMMQPGQPVFTAIVERFGSNVLLPDGTLDRAALARKAFAGNRIEDLNAIVHPAVIAAQTMWMKAIADSDPNVVAVVESALLFETRHAPAIDGDTAPWRTRFDRIVLVAAPEILRRRRFLERMQRNQPSTKVSALEEDFARRSAQQWSDERKAQLSDFVVRNDGSLADLQAHVAHLYRPLRAEAEDRTAASM